MPAVGSQRVPGGATTLGATSWAATGVQGMAVGVSRVVGSIDITAPFTVYVSETATRVSLVTGFNQDTVTWSVNEDAQAWQIREVTSVTDSIAVAGQIVASGTTVAANVSQNTIINASALTAAEGTKTLKIFAQDLAENWSA